MDEKDIKTLIKEEVNKQLSELGIKKPKQEKEVKYYNPMYMRDSWYND